MKLRYDTITTLILLLSFLMGIFESRLWWMGAMLVMIYTEIRMSNERQEKKK